MLTAEQLEIRKTGIGGSDAAAVLGLNPYCSPIQLWDRKVGLVDDPDLSDNQAVHFGNVLEDVVAAEYERRTGNKVRRRNQTFRHREHPFMLANIDRSVDGQRKVLECKTAGAFINADEWGPSGTDQVPQQYLIQCAHYMAVMDYDSADLAVLIGGRDFRVYHIARDRELEAMIIEREREFWSCVQERIMPAPINLADVERLHQRDDGSEICASYATAADMAALKERKSQIKQIESEIDEIETRIKAAMGDASTLLVGGKVAASWKMSADSKRFDAKALEKDHPALYGQYLKTVPGSRRFLIK